MVEHHSVFIKKADWVIDLGPGASDKGGKLVYQGSEKPKGVKSVTSSTFLVIRSLLCVRRKVRFREVIELSSSITVVA